MSDGTRDKEGRGGSEIECLVGQADICRERCHGYVVPSWKGSSTKTQTSSPRKPPRETGFEAEGVKREGQCK